MRVLVDTSVWVDFFNGYSSDEAEALARLIREEADILTCGLIASEVLQGFKRETSRKEVERHFLEMEWLTPSEPATYLEASTLYRRLRAKGFKIRSTIDCLIAQLASEHDTLLLSKDRDLRTIIDSKLAGIRSLPVG